MRLGVVLVAMVACPLAAVADSRTELQGHGEELARAGKYREAIDAFKQADKLEPRASHACLIGLAYIRRELWSQAEIFLAMCHARATSSDPVPDWVGAADEELAKRLPNASVAPVAITVEPATAGALVSVSTFAPDEQFAPRTLHLATGKHVLTATAEGFEAGRATIDVVEKEPRSVTITLRPIVEKQLREPEPIPPESPRQTSSKVPLVVTAAGGALVVAGAVFHVLAFKPARDDLLAANELGDRARYDAASNRFDSRRTVTIGLYGAGALAIATGVVLRYTVFRSVETPVRVSSQPVRGGAIVSVEWSR